MDERLAAYLATVGATPDALDGWTVRNLERAGEVVAFTITRGPEIHLVSLVGPRALSRRNILEHLAPLIEEHGYATTRVPLTETDHRLREALGFVRTWADEQHTYWALTALPYQKGSPPCQS
jgi:hypothetical protein